MDTSSGAIYVRLAEFLRELHGIVDAGIALGLKDARERKRPVNDSFLAAYVRDETKGRLRDLRGTPLECTVKTLNNGGILAIFKGCALRVRKLRNGGLPMGQSRALQLFYEQKPLALVWPEDREPPVLTELNLVVLWSFDPSTQALSGLELVLPGRWRQKVPHPLADAHESAPVVDYVDVNVELEEDEDIALEELDHDDVAEDEEQEDGE